MKHISGRLCRIKIALACLILSSASAAIAQQQQSLPVIQQVKFKKDTTSIISFGAKGDGITLNTQSINKTIASVSQKGGGVVLIPSGLWLTGPIELKSNVNLHLKRDAILQFTDDFNQYRLVQGNWEGQPAWRNQSPISGVNLENIAITGTGIIDGNGGAWRMVKKDKLTETQWKTLVASGGVVRADGKMWYPSEKTVKGSNTKNAGVIEAGKTAADYEDIKDFLRPNLLVLTGCKKILLEGVTFQNSPAWNLHPLLCEDLTLRNLQVKNPWFAQNGDGVDVESCKNVLIEGSTFDVGDDGICIKSGRDEAGRKRGVPTENVIVRNNVVYHAHGGFVIGSEMSGGAKNIWVYDCSFIGTDIGLRFKTTRGRGGVVENIYINNINMIDIPGEAILFDMYYAAVDPVPLAGEKREAIKTVTVPVTEATPQFRNFYIKDVVANGAEKAIFFRGLPEMNIKDIHLENVTIKAKKGIEIIEASGIFLKNINVITKDTSPVVMIQNSSNINISNLKYPDNSKVLFDVSGEKTKGVKISGTDVSKAKMASLLGIEVDKKALEISK
ncbi:Polygalacturonase [Pedobacter sp. Bi27]|uniref:glycoside hydrolase family 28 protein n=1 Tax=unclassified Pedobacter TaxID=2628915 RepID=UPI001DD4ACC4|nr:MULTISPECIES: glycoside hydrolase family 28 protein [unclassified Pedobacter]CAH0193569.1 Polygalacturonase [Pedobacter sp. Bi36]CAH0249287.1 Polygalacturonase [Pedobacter sp. Bi126]CAH0305182.1 Polygalacturonase [Pedobacter sp. Bi27]